MMSLAVKASGLVTPLGFNAEASCAAMRAGIRNVQIANFWDPEAGAFIAAGRVPLPQWWEGAEVLLDLVTPAISECFAAARPTAPSLIPVLVGVAGADQPDRAQGLEEHFLDAMAERLGVRLHPSSRAIPMGQVSGCLAVAEAGRLIETEGVACCIVAGVDSLLRKETVEAYRRQGRILTEANADGFSPGEAGAAVLVRRADGDSELQILGLGFAREPAPVTSDEPLRGEGLTRAIRDALADSGLALKDVAYRLTDLNGERYKFKEASLALGRLLKERVPHRIDLWHPIEYVGDVGAAIGPCVLALALHAGRKGYAPGSTVLCHFGNDAGERAALVARFVPGSADAKCAPWRLQEDS